MAQDTLAPWAEIVPGKGRMTIDEMMALPDDGWMYELVDGRLVRMPHSGGEASRIAARLLGALLNFVDANELGAITGADGEFDLTQPGDTDETALAPDVAFVRSEHIPATSSPEYKKAWPVAPDLVGEVVSPSQYRPEMAAKARRYLDAGVRLLWMVWPKYQQVDIWRAGANEPAATLGINDTLDGEGVLPGFTYPVARLFK
ncbi:MAG TPA: Uma2 family endonuclease [Ktedonobacterales bacterium]|nr:Uma2 family endonuclease [Ktedonobacterales bacterium]